MMETILIVDDDADCRLLLQKPDILLLDEPTNHLDLDMRLALSEALLAFDGALVLVSHDRHLLRVTCDQLVLVHGETSAMTWLRDQTHLELPEVEAVIPESGRWQEWHL